MPRVELKSKVLSYSLEIIKEQGISSLSIDEISRKAGIAKKTIYKHFSNKESIIAEMISEWTSTREIASPPIPLSVNEFILSLKNFFVKLSEKVLSSHSVAIFKLLQSDSEHKLEYMEIYQKNGIDNAASILNAWLKLVKEAGFLSSAWPENSAGYLQALIIAPLLRDISLGTIPPVPEYDPSARISKIIDDFSLLMTSSRQ